MDGAVKGVLIIIVILVVFGGGPVLIYRLYNQNKYGKRDEAVSGFARARGCEFLDGTCKAGGPARPLPPAARDYNNKRTAILSAAIVEAVYFD